MLMWKKDDQLVALAEKVLTSNPRMSVTRLAEGTRLGLMLAEREDAGLYSCELSALQSLQQVHEVVVRGERLDGWVLIKLIIIIWQYSGRGTDLV